MNINKRDLNKIEVKFDAVEVGHQHGFPPCIIAGVKMTYRTRFLPGDFSGGFPEALVWREIKAICELKLTTLEAKEAEK